MEWYVKAWKKYAVFGGRASRKEYWLFILFHIVALLIVSLVSAILEPATSSDQSVLITVYQLAVFIPSISVGCRRMHDTGRSGWWHLVPIVSLIFVVEEGARGNNKFGSSPWAETADTIY